MKVTKQTIELLSERKVFTLATSVDCRLKVGDPFCIHLAYQKNELLL